MVKLLLAHGAEDANPFWVFIALSNGNTETVKAMTSAAFADNLVEKKKDLNLKSIDEIGNSIMEELDITSLINDIIYKDIHKVHGLSFQELIKVFSNIYSNNKNLEWIIPHFQITEEILLKKQD